MNFPLISVGLHQPQIPPNTGNIIRLCANAQVPLHVIAPLGFSWDDRKLKRAGLDYHEFTACQHHTDTDSFVNHRPYNRLIACSTKGAVLYHQYTYQPGDLLLFGSETTGLPDTLRTPPVVDACIKIPMAAHSRSLNLSNSVAIILYEALRQLDFPHQS